MVTMTGTERPFVPAMGKRWLLPLYDPLTWLLRLGTLRQSLLREADLQPGQRVLDVGCGTGTLAILAKRTSPMSSIAGIDPDEMALARARRKARRAGVDVSFESGRADTLPYPDASVDRVLSSFMFHHLSRDDQRAMLDEVRRVLKPGGRLHLQDFTPRGHGDRGQRRLLEAGFAEARLEHERLVLGLLPVASYSAVR
jgi:ubiquinone/menaquinone biosynthesis C-methylase UbiE